MNSEKIEWEVKSGDRRKQVRIVFILALPWLLIFWVVAPPLYDIKNNIAQLLYVLGIVAILIAGNELRPYQNRKYILSDNGVFISKGKRNKQYSWTNFSSFMAYGFNGESEDMIPVRREVINDLHRVGSQREGKIFYLKTNDSGKVVKNYVVIRSEVESSDQVHDFLKGKLIEDKYSTSDELGLIKYEFN